MPILTTCRRLDAEHDADRRTIAAGEPNRAVARQSRAPPLFAADALPRGCRAAKYPTGPPARPSWAGRNGWRPAAPADRWTG